jgi:hypothetical protein
MFPALILVILSAAKDLTERSDMGRVADVRSFAPLRTTGMRVLSNTRKLTRLDAVWPLKQAREIGNLALANVSFGHGHTPSRPPSGGSKEGRGFPPPLPS